MNVKEAISILSVMPEDTKLIMADGMEVLSIVLTTQGVVVCDEHNDHINRYASNCCDVVMANNDIDHICPKCIKPCIKIKVNKDGV